MRGSTHDESGMWMVCGSYGGAVYDDAGCGRGRRREADSSESQPLRAVHYLFCPRRDQGYHARYANEANWGDR